ncbi:ARP2/3 actin-organizing complex subunit Sop2, partial [Cryomyces antarcticus]
MNDCDADTVSLSGENVGVVARKSGRSRSEPRPRATSRSPITDASQRFHRSSRETPPPAAPPVMPSSEVHHLFHHPVADHSFSADRQTLAVARDSNVELYARSGSKFALQDELRGHDKTVTGVDIAPRSGRIVTCSQDRNAYVWEPSPSGWKPTLVLLRINRAATSVRWSPSEAKFAVGSGARVIAVCYFEEENNWWVSKHLKKPIRSTITSVSWHPNSVLLAAGSTDGHARVFSSFIKGVDPRPEPSAWGERLPFNT